MLESGSTPGTFIIGDYCCDGNFYSGQVATDSRIFSANTPFDVIFARNGPQLDGPLSGESSEYYTWGDHSYRAVPNQPDKTGMLFEQTDAGLKVDFVKEMDSWCIADGGITSTCEGERYRFTPGGKLLEEFDLYEGDFEHGKAMADTTDHPNDAADEGEHEEAPISHEQGQHEAERSDDGRSVRHSVPSVTFSSGIIIQGDINIIGTHSVLSGPHTHTNPGGEPFEYYYLTEPGEEDRTFRAIFNDPSVTGVRFESKRNGGKSVRCDSGILNDSSDKYTLYDWKMTEERFYFTPNGELLEEINLPNFDSIKSDVQTSSNEDASLEATGCVTVSRDEREN